jgi:hypothetical protein
VREQQFLRNVQAIPVTLMLHLRARLLRSSEEVHPLMRLILSALLRPAISIKVAFKLPGIDEHLRTGRKTLGSQPSTLLK